MNLAFILETVVNCAVDLPLQIPETIEIPLSPKNPSDFDRTDYLCYNRSTKHFFISSKKHAKGKKELYNAFILTPFSTEHFLCNGEHCSYLCRKLCKLLELSYEDLETPNNQEKTLPFLYLSSGEDTLPVLNLDNEKKWITSAIKSSDLFANETSVNFVKILMGWNELSIFDWAHWIMSKVYHMLTYHEVLWPKIEKKLQTLFCIDVVQKM